MPKIIVKTTDISNPNIEPTLSQKLMVSYNPYITRTPPNVPNISTDSHLINLPVEASRNRHARGSKTQQPKPKIKYAAIVKISHSKGPMFTPNASNITSKGFIQT
jgi:hypothetical protein